jgi:hypothetical protein
MTNKDVFIDYLKSKHFKCRENFNRLNLVPFLYKTELGDHCLIYDCNVCMFDGCNTSEGELGCITFCYCGKRRKKHCRNVEVYVEFLKCSLVPKSAKSAITAFEAWKKEADAKIKTWKQIM